MIDGVIKYSIEHTTKDINISVREKNKDSFFITATQTGELSSLTKEYYTYIENYDFSNFSVNSFGRHKPSSEALSHAMIYQINPEINAVIHIHSKALWNFMKENNSLFTTAEYGTVAMVEEIASLYENKNPFGDSIFVMKGHEDGVIAFGKSIKEAELILCSMIRKYLTK